MLGAVEARGGPDLHICDVLEVRLNCGESCLKFPVSLTFGVQCPSKKLIVGESIAGGFAFWSVAFFLPAQMLTRHAHALLVSADRRRRPTSILPNVSLGQGG